MGIIIVLIYGGVKIRNIVLKFFCLVSPFSPFNLDRDPIASKGVGGQRKEQDTTFISSILGFKCQKTKGRYKQFGRIFVYLVEKRR